ncbi:hypothetical protein [Rhodopirellula europaea]|uniref:hypothetical protein n=1 Tax=Rhodopirellula europaea TaxID=1263866 RepID=UPI003D283E67
MDAETVRDQALAISGLLSDEMHGPAGSPTDSRWRMDSVRGLGQMEYRESR